MPLEKSRAIFLTRMQHAVSVIYFLSISLSLSLSLSLPLSLSLSLSLSQRHSLCCMVGRLGERKRKRAYSHRPRHTFYFSIIAIFIGIPSWSLCGGESYLLQSLKVLYLKILMH